MQVTHLYHSGIALETDTIQVFIDVISDIAHIVNSKKHIYFLVTHSHRDHFDATIFQYADERTHFILSDDIRDFGPPNTQKVMPNKHYQLPHFELNTFGSTDMGVSFLLRIDGMKIFHAGDLNWWHWENDNEETQLSEEETYKAIVRQLPADLIDMAFIPCDPRLERAMTWAVDYFLTVKNVRYLVPIHFRSHFEVSEALSAHHHQDPRILVVSSCDQALMDLSPVEGIR